mgnify:CR=1 FL=1
MGKVQRISCKACETSWQCETGLGRGHLMLESVASCFSSPVQEELLDYGKMRNILPGFRFSYQLAGCPICRKVVSVPVILWGEPERLTVGECPMCDGTVQTFSELNTETCPSCHEKGMLQTEEIGLWD